MKTIIETLKDKILIHNPKEATIKVNKKTVVSTLPHHSCYSACLDESFEYIRSVGGKFRGVIQGTPWVVKFTLPINK